MIAGALALRRDYPEWKRQQRAGPEERIRHRQELKAELTGKLAPSRRDYSPELIVRDLARVDDYPETDARPWGISPWFKVEIKGLYHRGLEVFLAVEQVSIDGSVARPASGGRDGETTTVFVVGRVPFDAIVTIDWEGDEYYPMPHVYCWFDEADGPYEAVVLYERSYGDFMLRREDLQYKPRQRSRLGRWRDHRGLQKAQREYERAARSSA